MTKYRYSFPFALREIKRGGSAQLDGGPVLRAAHQPERIVDGDGTEWVPDRAALMSADWRVTQAPAGAEISGAG